ncbi:hypothetical protein CSC67_02375 [Pusillimonas caeni]|uniref:hypothetical protein n=1 Tax=Pusillimonas caeni TaxID=1348472 RepID=UPI00107534BB|nr:hypothetical protein [Pusillimonas caeni]TFL15593.1 hypothetical protein CSC67_02375 [Pusillimonas caeni]
MENDNNAKPSPANETSTSQMRSTIEFPYTDLDNAVAVARAVHQAGGTACESEQLAAQLGIEASGGGFRLRVNGAKVYGLITYERGGRISLTELGRKMIDQNQEREARVLAFMTVPLYSRVYDEFKGSALPPQAGLERTLERIGVGAKVKDKARQVMMRSAKQAGFLDAASDRLVKPVIRQDNSTTSGQGTAAATEMPKEDGKRNGSQTVDGLHPFIQGLLSTLPSIGTAWGAQERVNWLKTAESIFKMIYPDDEHREIDINIKEDKKSPQ